MSLAEAIERVVRPAGGNGLRSGDPPTRGTALRRTGARATRQCPPRRRASCGTRTGGLAIARSPRRPRSPSLRALGVLPRLAKRATLAEQVPALVEGNLDSRGASGLRRLRSRPPLAPTAHAPLPRAARSIRGSRVVHQASSVLIRWLHIERDGLPDMLRVVREPTTSDDDVDAVQSSAPASSLTSAGGSARRATRGCGRQRLPDRIAPSRELPEGDADRPRCTRRPEGCSRIRACKPPPYRSRRAASQTRSRVCGAFLPRRRATRLVHDALSRLAATARFLLLAVEGLSPAQIEASRSLPVTARGRLHRSAAGSRLSSKISEQRPKDATSRSSRHAEESEHEHVSKHQRPPQGRPWQRRAFPRVSRQRGR